MKKIAMLFAAAVFLSMLAFPADYNLGKLAAAGKINFFNRTLDQTKADAPESVHLNSADGDGLAWITDVEFSRGIIELEVKGKDQVPAKASSGWPFTVRTTRHSMPSTCDRLTSGPRKRSTEATPSNTSPCPSTTGAN